MSIENEELKCHLQIHGPGLGVRVDLKSLADIALAQTLLGTVENKLGVGTPLVTSEEHTDFLKSAFEGAGKLGGGERQNNT